MALIRCRECGRQVSSTAKVCPQCGGEQTGNLYIWHKPYKGQPSTSLEVEVIGVDTMKLRADQFTRLDVPDGRHTISVTEDRRGWNKQSKSITISVSKSGVVALVTGFQGRGPLGLLTELLIEELA